jgi:hypothetical protein
MVIKMVIILVITIQIMVDKIREIVILMRMVKIKEIIMLIITDKI